MKEYKLRIDFIDLTGKRFGRWEVLEYSHVKKSIKNNNSHSQKGHYWKCKCDCGVEKVVRGDILRRGHSTSCGCYHQEIRGIIARKEKGHSGFRALYQQYKTNAKVRNIPFYLSKEDVKHISSCNCHYCGIEPSMKSIGGGKRLTKEGKEHSAYVYNGIDRVDNKLFYSIDNVVPCCANCNRSKWEMSYEEFIEHTKRICNHLKLNEESKYQPTPMTKHLNELITFN